MTVLLYVLIVLAGCASIFAASYEAGSAEPLSFSNFYMKQLVWVGAAWVTALVVLLLDVRFWHMFAYPAYFAGLLLLLAALAVGKGGERRQGVVRVRIVPRAARRVREDRHGAGRRPRHERLFVLDLAPGRPCQGGCGAVHAFGHHRVAERHGVGHRARLVPFVLYREGLNKWLCIPVLLIAALFIVQPPARRWRAARAAAARLHLFPKRR